MTDLDKKELDQKKQKHKTPEVFGHGFYIPNIQEFTLYEKEVSMLKYIENVK